jgi:hypothetical protein
MQASSGCICMLTCTRRPGRRAANMRAASLCLLYGDHLHLTADQHLQWRVWRRSGRCGVTGLCRSAQYPAASRGACSHKGAHAGRGIASALAPHACTWLFCVVHWVPSPWVSATGRWQVPVLGRGGRRASGCAGGWVCTCCHDMCAHIQAKRVFQVPGLDRGRWRCISVCRGVWLGSRCTY